MATATDAPPAVALTDVGRVYGTGEATTVALESVTFDIEAGQLVVLLGASGSGKTTCLNVIGAIEDPTSGHLMVDGVEVTALTGEDRTTFRRDHVGFVFQFYNLVPTLTALENVQLIAEITGDDAEARSERALDAVGLAHRSTHFPGQLSGGQQQLVAIARALVKDPALLLCDEPTGALDLDHGRTVLTNLRDAADRGATVVVVTHNSAIAQMADRVLRLSDGHLVDDARNPDPLPPGQLSW